MQGSQNLMSQSWPCLSRLPAISGSDSDLSLSPSSLVLSEDLQLRAARLLLAPSIILHRPRLSSRPSSTHWHSVPMLEKLPQIPQIRFLPHRPFYRPTRQKYLDFRREKGEKSQISLKDLLCLFSISISFSSHLLHCYIVLLLSNTFLQSAWPWLCVYLFSTPNWLSPSMSGVHWPSWSV